MRSTVFLQCTTKMMINFLYYNFAIKYTQLQVPGKNLWLFMLAHSSFIMDYILLYTFIFDALDPNTIASTGVYLITGLAQTTGLDHWTGLDYWTHRPHPFVLLDFILKSKQATVLALKLCNLI